MPEDSELADLLDAMEDDLNCVEALLRALFIMAATLDSETREAFQRVAVTGEIKAQQLKDQRERAWTLARA